jgi:hypothetical protein
MFMRATGALAQLQLLVTMHCHRDPFLRIMSAHCRVVASEAQQLENQPAFPSVCTACLLMTSIIHWSACGPPLLFADVWGSEAHQIVFHQCDKH